MEYVLKKLKAIVAWPKIHRYALKRQYKSQKIDSYKNNELYYILQVSDVIENPNSKKRDWKLSQWRGVQETKND